MVVQVSCHPWRLNFLRVKHSIEGDPNLEANFKKILVWFKYLRRNWETRTNVEDLIDNITGCYIFRLRDGGGGFCSHICQGEHCCRTIWILGQLADVILYKNLLPVLQGLTRRLKGSRLVYPLEFLAVREWVSEWVREWLRKCISSSFILGRGFIWEIWPIGKWLWNWGTRMKHPIHASNVRFRTSNSDMRSSDMMRCAKKDFKGRRGRGTSTACVHEKA